MLRLEVMPVRLRLLRRWLVWVDLVPKFPGSGFPVLGSLVLTLEPRNLGTREPENDTYTSSV
jgi:hypothetical protein